MTHDPLCPLVQSECPGRDRPHFIVEGDTWCGGCQIECQCPLIAKVRVADAQKRVQERREVYAEGILEGRSRSSRESSGSHKDAYARGRESERKNAIRVMAEIHTISETPQHNSCHWRGDNEPDRLICVRCSDFEYTFEPWPCADLRDFAEKIGYDGDLRQVAVSWHLDLETKARSLVPAPHLPTDDQMRELDDTGDLRGGS